MVVLMTDVILTLFWLVSFILEAIVTAKAVSNGTTTSAIILGVSTGLGALQW
jgi:4-amino-4-deoxy-L-arabinose transferase-like glycosyltransferase